MTKWDEYFKIEEVDHGDEGTLTSSWFDSAYVIKVIATDEVVGTYKDQRYAIKQAKYKFKRIQHKVEKILLG